MCGKSKQQLTTTATAAAVKAAFKDGARVKYVGSYSPHLTRDTGTVVADSKTRETNVRVNWDSYGSIFGVYPSNLELVVEPQEAPKVPKRATAVATEDGVTLHLTTAEAEALMIVAGRTGGSISNSPNKYVSRIWEAFEAAGVAWEPEHYVLENSKPLIFKDYPAKAPKVTPKAPKAPEVKPVEAVKPVATKFQVGDRVKVVDAALYTTLKVGDTGTIALERKGSAGDWEFNVSVDEDRPGMIGTYGLSSKNLELVSKVKPAEVAPEAPRTIQVGDRVKVVSSLAAFREGETAQVVGKSCSGLTLESTGCGQKRTGYAKKDQVELLAA
jgi:hypothetical protein